MYPARFGTLRSAAVLAFLSFISVASALTVSATYSCTDAEMPVGGGLAGLQTSANVAQFDPSLGVLQTVTVSTTAQLHFTTEERAPFGPGQAALSIMGTMLNYAIAHGDFVFGPLNAGIYAAMPPAELQQGEIALFEGTLTQLFSTTISSSDGLAHFTSGPLDLLTSASVRSTTFYGSAAFTLSTTSIVTYTYTIPDEANPAILLGFAAVILLCGRHALLVKRS